MERESLLLEGIGHLYDAATDMGKWPCFLDFMMPLFDAVGAHMMHFNYQESRMNFSVDRTLNDRIRWRGLQQRFEELLPEDPRIRTAQYLAPKPVSCRQHMTTEALHASRVYQEVLQFTGVEYTLGVNIPGDNEETMTGLALFRGTEGRPFDQEECDLLGRLIPHIKRAVKLQKRLFTLESNSKLAFAALDRFPMGIVLTTAAGGVIHLNASARDLAKHRDGLVCRDGRITASHREDALALAQAIQQVLSPPGRGGGRTGIPLTLRRRNDEEPLAIMVSSLQGGQPLLTTDEALAEPTAILFITDPKSPQEAPAELLQRLFGLTPGEGRLLEKLVAGMSLDDIAAAHSVSIHTVRSQLKAVLSKTGASRQSELIKRVMDSPVWLQSGRNAAKPV